jgi:hypothetical protein
MAIRAELVPLCNLYDRHILRQKMTIQLSMPTSEQKKIRNSGGDTVVQKADQLNLWYLTHRAQRVGEDRTSLNFPQAVGLSEDDVIVISDTEDAEGVLQEDEDDPMKLPMDLNQGCPDYRTMWIAGAQF